MIMILNFSAFFFSSVEAESPEKRPAAVTCSFRTSLNKPQGNTSELHDRNHVFSRIVLESYLQSLRPSTFRYKYVPELSKHS